MGTRCGQPSGLRVGPMSVWLPAGWRGGRWPGAGCRIHTQSRGGYGRLAEPVSPGTAHGWGLSARRPCCCPQIPPIPFRHFLRGSPRSGSVSPRGGREGLIPQVCCSREPPLAAPPHTPGCRLLSCHSCGCSSLLPSHLRGREEPGPPTGSPATSSCVTPGPFLWPVSTSDEWAFWSMGTCDTPPALSLGSQRFMEGPPRHKWVFLLQVLPVGAPCIGSRAGSRGRAGNPAVWGHGRDPGRLHNGGSWPLWKSCFSPSAAGGAAGRPAPPGRGTVRARRPVGTEALSTQSPFPPGQGQRGG